MTQITTGQQIDPRGVNHPAHYNKHPSGVEAIEVCRYMNPFPQIGRAHV